MFTSTSIIYWVLLNLVAISGDALISEDDAIKSQEAAKKYLRVISVTNGNESSEVSGSSAKTNNNEGSGSPVRDELEGVIDIFNKTSRLQCAHKCRMNEKCKDVAYEDGNTCPLLDPEGTEPTGRMEIIHSGMVIWSYVLHLSFTVITT